MTNVPPPDPNSSRLGLDELVGILIAFATIGTILALALSRDNTGFNFGKFLFPSATNEAAETEEELTPDAQPVIIPREATTPTPIVIEPSPSPVVTPIATPILTPNRVVPAPVPAAPNDEVVVLPANSTPVQEVSFPDVPQDLWARPYIETLAERDIFTGLPDGTFRPNGPMTRAEFAVLLENAFEQRPKLPTLDYTDVSPKFWASPAIQDSVQGGFLRGYPNNNFQPNQNITKVQVLVALASGLGLTSATASPEVLKIYQDAAQIPNYATDAVTAATQAGLVVNYPQPKVLNPNQNATRAEVAALVYQGLVRTGKVQPIPSDYLVKP
jgi:hypothetical protein